MPLWLTHTEPFSLPRHSCICYTEINQNTAWIGLNSFVLTKEGEEWICILSNLYFIYDQHIIPMSINTFEWNSPLTRAGATQSMAMSLAFCGFYIKDSTGPEGYRDLRIAVSEQIHWPIDASFSFSFLPLTLFSRQLTTIPFYPVKNSNLQFYLCNHQMQRQQTVNQQSVLSPSKFCREFWWWLSF